MDKMTLLVDRKDIRLSCEGNSIRIDCPGRPLQRIPLNMLGHAIIYGNPLVDCSVWRKLSDYGVPAMLLPSRGKGDGAYMGPGLSNAVMVRISQYRTWFDEKEKIRAAAWILGKKLEGFIRLAEIFKQDVSSFQTSLSKVGKAGSAATLRGIEGSAAKEWFALMGKLLASKWQFKGRNRRPPRDPVNAMLSLGYTLMVSDVRKAVVARGLDPCLGFLHEPYPGRDSLVLDLAEAFRPGVDAVVLDMADGIVSPKDFTTGDKDGCRLSKDGRGRYYQAFEDARMEWPLPPVELNDEEAEISLAAVARRLTYEFARTWGAPEAETGGEE